MRSGCGELGGFGMGIAGDGGQPPGRPPPGMLRSSGSLKFRRGDCRKAMQSSWTFIEQPQNIQLAWNNISYDCNLLSKMSF